MGLKLVYKRTQVINEQQIFFIDLKNLKDEAQIILLNSFKPLNSWVTKLYWKMQACITGKIKTRKCNPCQSSQQLKVSATPFSTQKQNSQPRHEWFWTPMCEPKSSKILAFLSNSVHIWQTHHSHGILGINNSSISKYCYGFCISPISQQLQLSSLILTSFKISQNLCIHLYYSKLSQTNLN